MLDVHMRLTHILAMTLDSYLSRNAITEATFAAMIGVDQSTVNRLRKGQVPSPRVMKEIADKTLGKVTANDFFGIAA